MSRWAAGRDDPAWFFGPTGHGTVRRLRLYAATSDVCLLDGASMKRIINSQSSAGVCRCPSLPDLSAGAGDLLFYTAGAGRWLTTTLTALERSRPAAAVPICTTLPARRTAAGDRVSPAAVRRVWQSSADRRLLLRVGNQRRRVKIVVSQRPAQRAETTDHRRQRRQRQRPSGGDGQRGILPHPGCCYSFHAGAVR